MRGNENFSTIWKLFVFITSMRENAPANDELRGFSFSSSMTNEILSNELYSNLIYNKHNYLVLL